MSHAVVDASAVLAYLHDEPGAAVVGARLASSGATLASVNLAEVTTRLADRGVDVDPLPGELGRPRPAGAGRGDRVVVGSRPEGVRILWQPRRVAPEGGAHVPTTRVDRTRVLAYRAWVQGLHGNTADPLDLAVLGLGVQDTPPGSATHALAVRGAAADDVSDAVATTWSVRGAPHVHRRGDLVALAPALWPWSDADALARLDTSASPVRASGMPAREALRFVAEQIADIVTEPIPKGQVSTALTPRIPPAMTVDCRRCEATHIVETLFRSAVLPAGIVFEPDTRVVTFVPIPDWPGVPEAAAGTEAVIGAYLRLLGPATPVEVASFLGSTRAEVETQWPDGLVEVEVDRRGTAWLPEDAVGDLLAPPDPPAVRLLPPSDPWLQARDRDLIVPDRERQQALWPILGRPGALLVDGDIAGTWRGRKKGRRLEVTVQPFGRLDPASRRALDEEAAIAAAARGAAEATVIVA